MILEFMAKYEPIWLSIAFLISILFEAYTAWTVKREFDYDEQKDLEKKQRRTKTTKKTTTQPSGASVIEEQTETVEPTDSAGIK